MNTYATLAEFKSLFSITGNTWDSDILSTLEEGSRQFDRDTDRFYYIYEGTFYQDGGATRVILDWDVQSITTLKVDTDGDGNPAVASTYESAYDITAATTTTSIDAFLYPLNITPKTRLEANPWGKYGHFGSGIRNAIRIEGVFGYGNDWPASYIKSSGTVLTATITSTAETLTVSTGNLIFAGHTLRIGNEQLYVYQEPTGVNVPIERAMNGTTAAAPSTETAISIYQYPKAVKKAVLIYAMRTWKRRESSFQNVVGNPELGTVTVWKGDDPDYRKTVEKYKKVKRGWYIY